MVLVQDSGTVFVVAWFFLWRDNSVLVKVSSGTWKSAVVNCNIYFRNMHSSGIIAGQN